MAKLRVRVRTSKKVLARLLDSDLDKEQGYSFRKLVLDRDEGSV